MSRRLVERAGPRGSVEDRCARLAQSRRELKFSQGIVNAIALGATLLVNEALKATVAAVKDGLKGFSPGDVAITYWSLAVAAVAAVGGTYALALRRMRRLQRSIDDLRNSCSLEAEAAPLL